MQPAIVSFDSHSYKYPEAFVNRGLKITIINGPVQEHPNGDRTLPVVIEYPDGGKSLCDGGFRFQLIAGEEPARGDIIEKFQNFLVGPLCHIPQYRVMPVVFAALLLI